MTLKIAFLERSEGGSPSIERVFRAVAEELGANGVSSVFSKAPYGIGIFGSLLNIIFFRPPVADVYHITGHINYLALVLPKDRTVLTVHDLTILDFRKGFRRWLIKNLYFVWPVRRLQWVTAISDATKDLLIEVAGVPPSKVKVIENPVLVPENDSPGFHPQHPTILQIGTAQNKNLDRLIRALAGVSCKLRIVGALPAASRKLLHDLKIDYENDAVLDDRQIVDAYRRANMVTLCSTSEGFGLPIIEAQANGLPVITSDRSPMREVAGGAAMLVDPENIEDIRRAIRKLCEDGSLRDRLIQKGKENVKRFDVGRIAAEYLSIYSIVAAGRGEKTNG